MLNVCSGTKRLPHREITYAGDELCPQCESMQDVASLESQVEDLRRDLAREERRNLLREHEARQEGQVA